MGKMSVITDGIIQQLVKIGRLCVVESGKVYDVTDFAERHPGGPEKIAANVGRDVTEILQAPKSHRHSPAAYSMLKQYCIGEYAVNSKSDGKCTNGSISSNGTGHLNNNKGGCYFEDEMVDWSKPLMWQVAGLKDQYFDWVHRPVDRQIRLFKSDLVEYFSKCSWYIVPLVWVPVAAIFLWMAYDQLSENPVTCSLPFSNTVVEITSSQIPLLVLAGATCWTLAEYIIHRWLFHLKPPANIPLLIQFHFLMHGQHHKTPMDKRRLVFPPIPASGLALTIYLVYTSFFSVPVALALMAGTTLGYLVYDLTHYYLHHGTPRSQYFQELKRYHVMHHYVDQQNGFGISSKLWDYPFGTLIKDKAD